MTNQTELNTTKEPEENHERFLEHLQESRHAVYNAAAWLSELGFKVSIPPISKAETHSEWKSHADSGDLFIEQRVEVKKLSVSFSCKDDWPFGDKFIVCAQHSFDRACPKPYMYLIFSSDYQAVAIIKASSSSSWYVEERQDSRYSRSVKQRFYFCPIELVKFHKIG